VYAKGSGSRRVVILPATPDVPPSNEKASGVSSTPVHPAGPSGLALSPPVPSGKFFFFRFTICRGHI
jgi:hypothetical protein